MITLEEKLKKYLNYSKDANLNEKIDVTKFHGILFDYKKLDIYILQKLLAKNFSDMKIEKLKSIKLSPDGATIICKVLLKKDKFFDSSIDDLNQTLYVFINDKFELDVDV